MNKFASPMINEQGFIRALSLVPSGSKGWYMGKCPFCGKDGKLGVLFKFYDGREPHYHCWSAKCGSSGTLNYLARYIKRPDLMSDEAIDKPMELDVSLEEPFMSIDAPEIAKPVGFRRVYHDRYLNVERSMTEDQLMSYEFGTTKLDRKLKNGYIIALIRENGKCVGYLGRSTMSKSEIEAHNEVNPDKQILRYCNSNSDFEKLVYGLDELAGRSIALVTEGIFSKHAVDRKLKNFMAFKNAACVCTFGAKFSEAQALKIRAQGVRTLIFLWEEGTISEAKKAAALASKYFEVFVASLMGGDPDELEQDRLLDFVERARDFWEFHIADVDIEKFKL